MNSTPLFTIFIPTIGRLSYLRAAIASAQAQTYPALEIIVGDEMSSDGTQPYIAEVAAADQRLRTYRSERRLGMPGNWQRGLDLARGEYMAIVSDDDILDARFVERCVARFLERDAPQVVSALYEVIDAEGKIDAALTRERVSYYRGQLIDLKMGDAHTSPPMMSSAFQVTWARQFGFWEDAGVAADVDFYRRAGVDGFRIGLVDEVLVQYRIHGRSTSSVQTEDQGWGNLNSMMRTEREHPAITQTAAWQELRASSIYDLVHCHARTRQLTKAMQVFFTYHRWMPLGLRVKCALRVLLFPFLGHRA